MPDKEIRKNPQEPEQKKTDRKLTLEERLKLVDSLRGCCKGGPSMADELIKERKSDKW